MKGEIKTFHSQEIQGAGGQNSNFFFRKEGKGKRYQR